MSDRPNVHVIIGNGQAGTGAAEAIRKRDPDTRIVLIGSEPYTLYNRIALPPFLKSKVTEQKVMIRSLEWHQKLNIELMLSTTVECVDTQARTVQIRDGDTIQYDRLLVATGGTPLRLQVPGADTDGVFYFQTLDDSKAIVARAEQVETATVTGGSFISYELTEAFAMRGLKTTWVMRGPWFLRRILCEEGGRLVARLAEAHDVQIVTGDQIASVHSNGNGRISKVKTANGEEIESGLLGCGLGLGLNTGFLQGSGIEVNRGVVCDEYLQTKTPEVFAAGDIAEFYEPPLRRHTTVGTWHNAGAHGKVAGANMVGERVAFEDVQWYASTLFDSRIESVGNNPEIDKNCTGITIYDGGENYRRAFFLDNRMVGMVSIGELPGRKRIAEIIKSRQPIEGDPRTFLEQL